MSIFDHEPADWADLQNLVGQLFSELGCEVAVGKRLELVRGRKEIDVWVRDPGTSPPAEYLCECKFWTRPIPQEVIHSFRTVVSDYGAHRGFIISHAAFQSGAREAVRNTNVDLVTFVELQTTFFDRWRVTMDRRFASHAQHMLLRFRNTNEKLLTTKWTEKHEARFYDLMETYRPFFMLNSPLPITGFAWHFPISVPQLDAKGTREQITLSSYRQLYDFMDAHKDTALRALNALYASIDE